MSFLKVDPQRTGDPGQTLHSRCQTRPASAGGNFVTRSRRRLRDVLRISRQLTAGGARRDRTDDLMLAKHALYQLSYGPKPGRAQESKSSIRKSAVGGQE